MAISRDVAPARAVGVKYSAGEGLPYVVVKAAGGLADDVEKQFVKRRGRHRVVENGPLVDALMRLPVASAISPSTYELVAALLLHVFSVEAKLKSEKESGSS